MEAAIVTADGLPLLDATSRAALESAATTMQRRGAKVLPLMDTKSGLYWVAQARAL